ncbi:glycosyltransferase family 2 protein [Chitinophagaceae bacterium MMS25-I14]
MNSAPLISCICITRGKPELLSRAIECFDAQSYPRKELVLLCESDDEITLKWLTGQQKDRQYRLVLEQGMPKRSLGQLRNRAIKEAAGTYICQWDDDDWYHADRLKLQQEALESTGYDACVLGRWLLYDSEQQEAYLSHNRLWEGSLLCKRTLALQYAYPDVAKGEDTPFIELLYRRLQLYVLGNMPQLYIYNWHGKNTWHRQHWNDLFRYGRKFSGEEQKLVTDIMLGKINVTDGAELLNRLVMPA